MTTEMLQKAIDSIKGNSPIANARRRNLLSQIYALQEQEYKSDEEE